MQITARGQILAALLVLGLAQLLNGQANPQNFVSVTPCRIADTRTSNGGAGPIPAGAYRNFTIAGLCGVPSTAAAFSLNVTAVPPGALTFLSVLPAASSSPSGPPSSSTLNDPLGTIVANAAIVPDGNGGAITIYVSNRSDVILDIDGYFVDQTNSSTQNTALGTQAGGSTGTFNTAVGYEALPSGSGDNNTATGYESLQENTTGQSNTAFGRWALQGNTTGSFNTALGADTLFDNGSGSQNVALGYGAGSSPYADSNPNGITAVGYDALYEDGGSYNIGLGWNAGLYVSSGSYNIEIGNEGTAGDNGIIRVGTAGTQTSTFIAGIYGATAGSGATVIVNSNGQLGTVNSSLRFKENVRDMADGSDALMQLRPVEFQYKQPEPDGTKPLQFGLVAEEVAKVYPELVVRGKDGQVDSVQYHQLPAMLLNEIQKQHRTIEELKATNSCLEAEMKELRALLVSK